MAARKWVENGAILKHRIEPERAIYTISCGFGRGLYYRQLRFVKNCFRRKWRSLDFGGGSRVADMLTFGHVVWVASEMRRRKGEQFTPELLWQGVTP